MEFPRPHWNTTSRTHIPMFTCLETPNPVLLGHCGNYQATQLKHGYFYLNVMGTKRSSPKADRLSKETRICPSIFLGLLWCSIFSSVWARDAWNEQGLMTCYQMRVVQRISFRSGPSQEKEGLEFAFYSLRNQSGVISHG